MPLLDIRSVCLPYCLEIRQNGSCSVLNREYQPIRENIRIRRLTSQTAAKFSFNGNKDVTRIYLYNDGCVPTHNKANMKAYLNRLGVLAGLKVKAEY